MKTRKLITTLLISCFFLNSFLLQAQDNSKIIVGSWNGKLAVQGMQLRLVFNISVNGDNEFKATMDSPDQGAKDIPMGKVSWDGQNLTIDAPNMRASYKGTLNTNSIIKGTWVQAGQSFPLTIQKKEHKKNTIDKPILTSEKAIEHPAEVCGTWLGKLGIQGINLRLIFNLSKDENNNLAATMDSPDQGAQGIPMGKVSWDGQNLTINAPDLRGKYTGTKLNDSTFSGTWSQAGKDFELDIIRQIEKFELKRPQEPKGPFSYLSEDLTFPNKKADIKLAGTLTLPKGEGPFPAVILISGSGPQNRDEEIFGHKPFLVIADDLTKKGFAVLRYDDRGVNESEGSQLNSTSADYATDARAAFDFLKNDKRINPSSIGFAGHSEGGLICQILAAKYEDIAFIISMAGPGVTGEEVLIEQVQVISALSGEKESNIEKQTKANRMIYSTLKEVDDNQAAEKEILVNYRKYLENIGEENIDQKIEEFKTQFSQHSYTWMRFFLKSDPQKLLKTVKCPYLAINGDKDVQVISETNLGAMEQTLLKAGHKDYTLKNFEGLNHMFQESETGLMNEYGEIEQTIAPVVLETISNWLKERFL